MKKNLLCLSAVLFFGLTSWAKNTQPVQNGDPKKDDKQVTFTLTKGYFSLFNLLPTAPTTTGDTLRTTEKKLKDYPTGEKK